MRHPLLFMLWVKVAFCATLMIAGSIPSVSAADAQNKIRIGVLLPLTGEYRDAGHAVLKGIQLGLFGIKNSQTLLVIRDTKSTQTGAGSGLNELLEEEVDAILGPIFTTEMQGIQNIYHDQPLISFSNNESFATSNTYIFGLPPTAGVFNLMHYAQTNGLTPVALVANPGPLAKSLADTAKKITKNIKVYWFSSDAADMKKMARTLIDDGVKALWIPEGGHKATLILSTLRFYLPPENYVVMGSTLWDGETTAADPGFVGALHPGFGGPAFDVFNKNYRRAWGETPTTLSALAYDAFLVICSSAFGTKSLHPVEGFNGASGHFVLNENGRINRNLSILKVPRPTRSGLAP